MKLSYRKHWSPDGTVYKQRVSLSQQEFEHLRDAVYAEIAQNLPRKDLYINTSGYELFMRPLELENNLKVCYLNNTQARFCNIFLGGKLKVSDRNIYIVIK